MVILWPFILRISVTYKVTEVHKIKNEIYVINYVFIINLLKT